MRHLKNKCLNVLISDFLEPSDHDPVNMFEVFKNPENFLAGPESNVNKTEKMHFVVVGAGIAGLTNARMLLAVGHHVCYCYCHFF